jgi:hypothetical protein
MVAKKPEKYLLDFWLQERINKQFLSKLKRLKINNSETFS